MGFTNFFKFFFKTASQKKKMSPSQSLKSQLVNEISAYQFNNLIRNPVRFVFLDLRADKSNPYPKSMPSDESQALSFVRANAPSLEYPILLICETGSISKHVGLQLAIEGYTNVTLLAEGTSALEKII